ncbi:MAG: aminopeptidase P family protein [Deltaproteobacteria bacterium]|nr:MAG: aminopeptidase P family protein [Deltaproteobacteria bacterium]
MYNTEENTPKSELEIRINQLKIALEKNSIDAALILQKADLFYFAGTIQQSHLYVPIDGEPLLMVHKSFDRALAESALQRIIPLDNPKQIPGFLPEYGMGIPRTLGMELDVLPANMYLNYRELFEETKLLDISHLIRLIRSIKSNYEVGLIAEAVKFSDQIAGSVKEFLKEGISEIEFAGLVEARARKLGHQGVLRMRLWGGEMFYGHIMAGSSAAVPSYLSSPTGGSAVSPAVAQGSSFRPIRRHEPILVDYVFVYKGYLSDHTRIFAIDGLADDLIKAHHAMLDVQALVKKEAVPGVKAGQIYDMAIDMVKDLGYANNFMGFDEERINFVGHGIGIEIDEYPFLAKGQSLELQEGMIIALEPKLIFPGVGVVGIENTHVVTKKGLKQFGHFNEEINVV